VPDLRIYLPPKIASRLDAVAASFCISRRDFARAVLSAALNELEKEQALERNLEPIPERQREVERQ